MPRYECKLSEDVLAKANEELNEPLDNYQRLKLVDELLSTYKQQYPDDQLGEREQSDGFLLRFLRARKFDVDRACKIMHNYVHRREAFKEVFDKVDHPQLLKSFLDTRFLTVLEGRGRNESALMFLRPSFGCSSPVLIDMIACMIITMEKVLDKEENQIHGITVIDDLNYVSVQLVRQLDPSTARKMFAVVQETLPIRLKNVCMLNEALLFDVFFAVAKPFMKEKTRKRMVLVGTTWETLHAIVEPKFLPEAYGGLKSEAELNHEKWVSVLMGGSTAL